MAAQRNHVRVMKRSGGEQFKLFTDRQVDLLTSRDPLHSTVARPQVVRTALKAIAASRGACLTEDGFWVRGGHSKGALDPLRIGLLSLR
jgi:hypothetical protein